MKKLVSLILSVLITISVFAGCTKKNDTNSTNTNTSEATKQEPKSFVYMTRDSETAGTSYKTMVDIKQEALEKLTGVKIIWDVTPAQEYEEVMQLRFAAKKDMPDFVEIKGESSGAYLSKYLEDGIIRPLNELIEKNAPGFKKLLQDYPEYKEAITLPNGKIVGFGNVDATIYSASIMGIRKDWLDKLGLAIPKTMDDLYNVAKAFQQADFDGNGKKDTFGIGANDFWSYRQLGMGFGLHLTIGDGWAVRGDKVVYEFIEREYIDYLKFMNKAYTEGLLPKDMVNHKGDTQRARLLNGSVGIDARNGIGTILDWNNPNDEFQKAQPGAFWVPFAPSGPYGASAIPKEPTASRWRVTAITQACKYPDEAMKYWDTVTTSKEAKMINAYGIEGVTYNMVNGMPVPVKDPKFESGKFAGRNVWQQITGNEPYEWKFKEEWLVKHPQYNTLMTETKNIASQIKSGFVPAIPPVESVKRVNSIMGDLKTARDEAMTKFIIGETPITDENFNKYVKKLQDLGVTEILKIYQDGYNNIKGKK